MQTLFFASLLSLAAAQFPGGLPPIPGGLPVDIPVDCLTVLSQVCPDDNNDLCLQCANSLSFILARAGCDDSKYQDYCGNDMKCEDILAQFGCNARGQSPNSCYSCAQTNQAPLLSAGCDQALIENECERLTPDKSQCPDALERACGDLKGKGDFCEACVEDNVKTLVPAGCDYNATTAFCKGDVPDVPCENALDQLCGQYFQMGTDCFHCLAAEQDAVRKAGCQNQQLSDFCAPKINPQPLPPPPQGCLGLMRQQCPDTSNQVTCLSCVSADFEALMRVGCTKEEVIGYCQG